MTVTVSKPRLYIAGLPECPPHSIFLISKCLNLTWKHGNKIINENINESESEK